MSEHIIINEEVKDALAGRAPVVALESTIITHGMPFPDNLETAIAVEREVRNNGAVAATIAVLDGKIQIGLDEAQLEHLAKARDVLKLSRADLAFAVSRKRTGSTTVAATMIAANRAGVKVFATGGIGGVHRGAETSFDISADLEELAKTPVTVVSAGAKAILNLAATWERLETLGVPVIGFQCNRLPAFWSRASDHPCPLRLDTPQEIAQFTRTRRDLALGGGLLVANPIPRDDAIPAAEIESYIEAALKKAEAAKITGKDVTPFLLTEIVAASGGRALTANIALVKNNARLAAEIAVAERELGE
ncbi:MAG: pseudouridine-5'-phosphate glycosidase [Pseudomonadota bacterium]